MKISFFIFYLKSLDTNKSMKTDLSVLTMTLSLKSSKLDFLLCSILIYTVKHFLCNELQFYLQYFFLPLHLIWSHPHQSYLILFPKQYQIFLLQTSIPTENVYQKGPRNNVILSGI